MQTNIRRLHHSEGSDSAIEEDIEPKEKPRMDDLSKLKDISEKLKLATRRPSVLQWKQVIENRRSMGFYPTDDGLMELDDAVENAKSGEVDPLRKVFRKPKLCMSLSADTTRRIPVIDLNNNEVICDKNDQTNRTSNLFNGVEDKLSTLQPNMPNNTINKTVKMPNDVNDDGNHKNSVAKNRKVIKEFCCQSNDTLSAEESCVSSSNQRCRYIAQALGQLRKDLITMRIEDHKLAREILNTRSDFNKLRAQRTCDEHADMLDDFTYEMEEDEDIPGLIKACDLSSRFPGSILGGFSPLRDIGLSKMNLNIRRFSIR